MEEQKTLLIKEEPCDLGAWACELKPGKCGSVKFIKQKVLQNAIDTVMSLMVTIKKIGSSWYDCNRV